MFLKACSGFFSSILVLLLAFTPATQQAADPTTVSIDGSIRKISAADQAAPPQAHRPRVSRKVLQPAETAAEMDFEVVLKMRNFADLQKKVGQGKKVPRSEMSNWHYPLEGDYQRVLNWLMAQGFKIRRQDSSRLAVFARGSVQLIGKSLQVDFAKVTLDGKEYSSAVTAPHVPANLAASILSINGLQPHLQAHKHLVMPQAHPNSLTDTNPPYLPSQIAQAYHAQSLYDAGISGAGQTIAIVIDTFPLQSDLTTFWQTYHVNQTLDNIQFIQVVSGTLPAPSGEESLDVEWSSSIAPGAKVRVYATTDLFSNHLDEAYAQIFDDVTAHPELGIHQVSLSYGLGEQYASSGQVSADSQYFANLASAGVTVFVSSGDGGSTPGTGAAGDSSGPVQAETPASDPNVTSVGGTTLNVDAGGNPSSETAWNLSGGGTSIFFFRPTWQTGNGVPAGTMRTVPDVSCAADPATPAYVTLNGLQYTFGGTSWSSPTWAGFCALLNQKRANANLPPLGSLGPKIYPLLGTSNFRDITSGSNGNSATPGYDLVTGIGVPDVQNLSQTLVGLQTTPLVQTIGTGANTSFTVATSGTVTSYQWQRLPIGASQWNNVSDDSAYSGSATATLLISGASLAMSGDQFRCQVNNGTSVLTSDPPSVLVVDRPLVVTTLAGQAGVIGSLNGTGTGAQFSYPSGVAVDGAGNAYIADFNSDTIRKITPTGAVTTPYGQPNVVGSANGTGNVATFNTPNSVAADSSGNLYVADSGNSTVRKITPAGLVSTLAGRAGRTGTVDNVNGSVARFNNPQGIAVASSGLIYVADTLNNTIRTVTSTGGVSTLAGSAGTNGYADGTGTAAKFNGPISVAPDSQGNVYVADLYNFVVRKISSTGVVTTPYGQPGMPGRLDGVGNGALFNGPIGVAVDAQDNLYVMDSQVPPSIDSRSAGNNLLRRITPAGVVSTIAGSAGVSGSADGTGNGAQFFSLQSGTISSAGVVYLADTFNQTVRIGATGPIFTLQPVAAPILNGQSATFTTAFVGVTAPAVQWQRMAAGASSWVNVTDTAGVYAGATTPSLTVSNATLAMNGDRFQCVIRSGAVAVLTTNSVLLTVQTGYSQWASGFFNSQQLADSSISGPLAESKGDGTPNVLKYLVGINPTTAMSAADYKALPVAGVQTVSGTQYLTLTYRQNQTTAGLSIAVQTSTNVRNWQTITPDSVQTVSTDQATGDPIILIKVQTQNAAGLFIRLQVTSS